MYIRTYNKTDFITLKRILAYNRETNYYYIKIYKILVNYLKSKRYLRIHMYVHLYTIFTHAIVPRTCGKKFVYNLHMRMRMYACAHIHNKT